MQHAYSRRVHSTASKSHTFDELFEFVLRKAFCEDVSYLVAGGYVLWLNISFNSYPNEVIADVDVLCLTVERRIIGKRNRGLVVD